MEDDGLEQRASSRPPAMESNDQLNQLNQSGLVDSV